MAVRGGQPDQCLHGQGAQNLTGQLTTLVGYPGLADVVSLAGTPFASLGHSTMELSFCFQKHHRTMLPPT